VLSGKVISFHNNLLYKIITILSSETKKKISDKSFFNKYLTGKGALWPDYQEALKELKSYQDRGVFQKDRHTYQQEARSLEALLKEMKERFVKKQQKAALILNITHACNLRCRYCHFTGIAYTGGRKHEAKSMSFEFAQKLISNHLVHTKNNKAPVYIIFYGGEPLLEFQKLRTLIKHAREEKKRVSHKAHKIEFHVATNGVLLTKDIMKFCIKNRVHLQISIDGPKAVHDKNRVSQDGQGSFTQAVRNVKELKRISATGVYPKYFNECITINSTNFYQTDSEVDAVRYFFSHSRIFKDLHNAGKIALETAGTNSLKGKYKKKQLRIDSLAKKAVPETFEAQKIWIEKEKLRIKKKLDIFYSYRETKERKKKAEEILNNIIRNHEDVLMTTPGNEWGIRAMTGTCAIGGHKQFIDQDGKIYICTQVSFNKTTIIGEKGILDFKRIKKILSEHVLKFGHECRVCPIFTFCKECVVHSADDKGLLRFKRNSLNCHNYKNKIINKFSFIYSVIEEYPEFERFIRKEYHKAKNK